MTDRRPSCATCAHWRKGIEHTGTCRHKWRIARYWYFVGDGWERRFKHPGEYPTTLATDGCPVHSEVNEISEDDPWPRHNHDWSTWRPAGADHVRECAICAQYQSTPDQAKDGHQ